MWSGWDERGGRFRAASKKGQKEHGSTTREERKEAISRRRRMREREREGGGKGEGDEEEEKEGGREGGGEETVEMVDTARKGG